jgi:hypothetical protein
MGFFRLIGGFFGGGSFLSMLVTLFRCNITVHPRRSAKGQDRTTLGEFLYAYGRSSNFKRTTLVIGLSRPGFNNAAAIGVRDLFLDCQIVA